MPSAMMPASIKSSVDLHPTARILQQYATREPRDAMVGSVTGLARSSRPGWHYHDVAPIWPVPCWLGWRKPLADAEIVIANRSEI